MPNWCENNAQISAIEPDAQNRFRELILAMDEGRWFEYILPVPEGLDNLGDYSWRVEHWGTGREAFEINLNVHNSIQLEVSFDTAWSPPIGIYRAMHDMGFTINAVYDEPGMGFAGRVRAMNAEPFSDRSWDT